MISSTGHLSHNAPSGYHDDCVIALALANQGRWIAGNAGSMARLLGGGKRQGFPGQPPLAYFECSPMASDQTRQVVQDAVDLSKAGLKIDAGEVAEKTGYRVERYV